MEDGVCGSNVAARKCFEDLAGHIGINDEDEHERSGDAIGLDVVKDFALHAHHCFELLLVRRLQSQPCLSLQGGTVRIS